MTSTAAKVKIGLIGATGRTGGWVLEECLARGYPVVVLARSASKLEAYADNPLFQVIEGNALEATDVERLLLETKVVISTIGSPNKQTLVVEKAAMALVKAIDGDGKPPTTSHRIIWMTSTGVNEATDQAKAYPLFDRFKASNWLFGYGIFGFLQFKLLIPYVIGQDLWDDMGKSELVIRSNTAIQKQTVIVRPGNMWPASEAATFSEQWRKEGGEEQTYDFVAADEMPPRKWIGRRALAAALLDLVEDSARDGTAVSVF